jgi:hypothetical protein
VKPVEIKSPADQRLTSRRSLIASALQGAAIGAEYFDLVVALFEGVKRMGKLTPPKADRPSDRRRMCRV